MLCRILEDVYVVVPLKGQYPALLLSLQYKHHHNQYKHHHNQYKHHHNQYKHHYEVDMHLVTWITDYLTGRPQHVRIRDCSSDTVISSTGAPQGTVLSPVLFTSPPVHNRDFKYNSELCHMQKFSDDTAIVGCVRNGQEREYRSLVEDFVEWCTTNHLKLNITKTKEMCIDFRRSRPSQQPISIKGVDVEVVRSYRYLGVHLDERLDWSVNTDIVYKKAQSRLYFLRRLGSFRICQKLLLMFYQSVVASVVLFYAVVCWGGSISKRDAGRLDRLVRKAGSVLGLELESLTPLAERRALNKLLHIMDNVHHPLHSTIIRQRSSYSGRLLSQSCSTDRLRKSFTRPGRSNGLQLEKKWERRRAATLEYCVISASGLQHMDLLICIRGVSPTCCRGGGPTERECWGNDTRVTGLSLTEDAQLPSPQESTAVDEIPRCALQSWYIIITIIAADRKAAHLSLLLIIYRGGRCQVTQTPDTSSPAGAGRAAITCVSSLSNAEQLRKQSASHRRACTAIRLDRPPRGAAGAQAAYTAYTRHDDTADLLDHLHNKVLQLHSGFQHQSTPENKEVWECGGVGKEDKGDQLLGMEL
ncbi:hypothetical protein NFI96_005457 [Prochilodus magdalenae]|nr:hypothetical protein NFI96_005457 [Prochilodus magdalenae]